MKVALVVLAVVAVVAVAFAGYVWWSTASTARVPDVVGMTAADAKTRLAEAGYTAEVAETHADEVDKGQVSRQEPVPDAKLARGGTVVLWVSVGPSRVQVPDVAGLKLAEAQAKLRAADLNAEVIAGSSGGVARGSVYQQDPAAGTEVEAGTVVKVYENQQTPTAPMPSLIGDTEAQAVARLRQADLLLGSVSTQAGSGKVGTVVSQSVPANENVARGSKVNLVLAGGPPSVAVPDVLNMPYKAAETKLMHAGFHVRVTWTKGAGMMLGAVVRMNPKAGTQAPEGSLVVITVNETQQ